MKKLFILLFGLFLSVTGSSQSCLPDGITFTRQSEIDNFHINFPNCTQIEGDVTIIGPGAGRFETGFAILSDILAIHNNQVVKNA